MCRELSKCSSVEPHGDLCWQILGGQEGADVRSLPGHWPGAVVYLGRHPIFAGLWSDTVPEWLRVAILRARVMQLLVEGAAGVQEHDRMCTLEEVAAYLYTVSLEAPLAREWYRVYFWASDKVMRAHRKLPEGQTIWDIVDPKGDLGADRRELNDYERREYLDRLRRDIRRAVVKHQKKRTETHPRRRST